MAFSLPMASDCARSEARFITDAAKRVADQLALIESAAQDAQTRVRNTEYVVGQMYRESKISLGAARVILNTLLRPEDRPSPVLPADEGSRG